MKQILFAIAMLFSVAATAQEARGTSRDFWNRPIQVLSTNIRPLPSAGSVLGNVNGRWSSVSLPATVNKSSTWGVFQGSTDGDGEFTITHNLGTDSLAVNAISSDVVPYIFMVVAKTDTTVTIKVVTIEDGAFAPADSTAVKVDWYIRRFVIVDDIEGV